MVQGDWNPHRIVIVAFDSVDQARGWQEAPDYAELRAMLNRSSNTSVIITEGL